MNDNTKMLEALVTFLVAQAGGEVVILPEDFSTWMETHTERFGFRIETGDDLAVTVTVYEKPAVSQAERLSEAAGLLSGETTERWQLQRVLWLLSDGRWGEPHWEHYALLH